MPGLPRLKRGGRKRRAEQAGDAPAAVAASAAEFQIDRWEYVPVDPASTLVRLEGRPSEDLDLSALRLVVRRGEGIHEHPLLAPPTSVGDERWQLAFGIETPGPEARLELCDDEGVLAFLPALREMLERQERELRAALERFEQARRLADSSVA